MSLGLLEAAAFILLEVYSKIEELGLIGCALPVLRRLSDIATQANETDYARKFEMKIIEDAWYIDQVSQEVMAYERIGYIYYLQGNLTQAKIFHDKARGEGEKKEYFLRQGCHRFVKQILDAKLVELKNFNMNWLWLSYWGLTEEYFEESSIYVDSS